MFSQRHSVTGGGVQGWGCAWLRVGVCVAWARGVHGWSHAAPPPAPRLASGRYASHWNADFLITIFLHVLALFLLK